MKYRDLFISRNRNILLTTIIIGHISPGNNKTMEGKAISVIMMIRSQPRNGRAARQISPMVVPEGADPFITKSNIPKGGVDMAISRFRSMRMANHMGSKPSPRIMGI